MYRIWTLEPGAPKIHLHFANGSLGEMMGYKLVDADERIHESGSQVNWNESRYIDFWDPDQRIGGWFRIGNRPNAGYAEMSACINLPDGRTAFMFNRPKIQANTLKSGDLGWEIVESWETSKISYHGEMLLLKDAWEMKDPKAAFTSSPRADAAIDLVAHMQGLGSIMGHDQDHIDLIFLPGQADFHYQNLIEVTGRVEVEGKSWTVSGRGGADHSWGPRNWHAKIYLRWMIANVDRDFGFMLVRGVGPHKKTRSGFVWDEGIFHVVDDFEMKNSYAGAPNYELLKTSLTIQSGAREWTAIGTPRAWLPLRHKQKNEAGEDALLRIVKSPSDWLIDGRSGAGMCEWHDLMVDGKPVGIDD